MEPDAPDAPAPPQLSEQDLQNRAEFFKAEGNHAFAGKDFPSAIASYDSALAALAETLPADRLDASGINDEILVTLHSNRAEALLRLNEFAAALTSVNIALALDPGHKKSRMRKKKAEAGLGMATTGVAAAADDDAAAADTSMSVDEPPERQLEPQAGSGAGGEPAPEDGATQIPKQMGQPGGASGQRPVCAIVAGMAGSGKTTLMQRLNAHMYEV